MAARLAERATQPELSAREIEIVGLMADGTSNKQIAAILGVSDDTVHTHLKRIFATLNVTDRTATVTTAFRRRIVRLK